MKLDKDDVPLGVGIAYNLKKGIKSHVEDIEAEYDNIETIYAIKNALESFNCKVDLLEADADFCNKLNKVKPDIIFNIAEGISGRGREAQVPAILNFFGIPFTGSDEATLCISLDKALTKRLLATYKIKSPKYQLVKNKNSKLNKNMIFPLIIKPNAEGSSKGISDLAIVDNEMELKKLLVNNLEAYSQPFLIEEFIAGREFTVGIIGNGKDKTVFTPMEIVYRSNDRKHNIYSYDVKKNYKKYIEYVCPPVLEKKLLGRMESLAGKIFDVLECRDFARIDFRLSEDNEIYFIEINPLPGLAPGYSDYPMLAEFCGCDYDSLVKMVLYSALKRHNMLDE